MIDKKLIHFKNKEIFDEQCNLGNISDVSIVFIKDSCTIRTHSQDYKFVNWSILEKGIPQGYDDFITVDGLNFNALDGPFYVKT